MKSMHTNTNVNENQEFLFLRLKKRTKFVSILIDVYINFAIEKRNQPNRIKRE
jgi:hypothetical protein